MLKPHVDILNCCISPDWVFVVLLCPIGTALSDAIEESDSPTSLFIVVIAAVACCSVGRGHHCLVYAMTYIGGVNCCVGGVGCVHSIHCCIRGVHCCGAR